MNHRRLELTQTDSRAYINLGSLHASPHNKEALHGTWMQSRWSSRIQRTFWPKILIDSLKIIDCTNPFFFFLNAALIYQSTLQYWKLFTPLILLYYPTVWPFVMSLIPVSDACLVYLPFWMCAMVQQSFIVSRKPRFFLQEAVNWGMNVHFSGDLWGFWSVHVAVALETGMKNKDQKMCIIWALSISAAK